MKKTLPAVAAFVLIILFTQCAERELAAHSKDKRARKKTLIKSAYTKDQLAQGKSICMNKCTDCHDLHEPAEFTVKEWNYIFPGMCRKAKLTVIDSGLVKAWVMTNAKTM